MLVFLGFHLGSNAQSILLQTQADVDAFDPTLTVVNGTLRIGAVVGTADITDLSPLSNLTTIVEDLDINGNDILTNVDGLNNITSIGGTLRFINNYEITNLDGMSGLISIGNHLTISIPTLTSIDGLSNLTSIGGGLIYWQ